jgi:enterochelin esterase-like enzyme
MRDFEAIFLIVLDLRRVENDDSGSELQTDKLEWEWHVMPVHNFQQPKGRIDVFEIDSSALKNNLLGDPTTRRVAVYLPMGYDESAEDYPLFVDLVGFTGSGFSHLNWSAFDEGLPQRLDRLIAEDKMGKVIVALPDCFTSLGGNQYINSSAMGHWADFLTAEMIPAIEEKYRVRKGRENRAVFGKSSGGYGAIVHGMLNADVWGAVACHSGDMGFELVYQRDLPEVLVQLAKYDQSIPAFMEHVQSARKMPSTDMHILMMLAMAATYDPDAEAPFGIRLPVTTDTCELIPARWQRWQAWDPLNLIEREDCQSNLRKLKGCYIDCGVKDQYYLIYGARRLNNRLQELQIDCAYDEFDDNHSGINYRMDESLPYLYRTLEK